MGKQNKCPECQQNVPAHSKFCSACGAKMNIAKYECPNCQEKIQENTRFCPECGTSIKKRASGKKPQNIIAPASSNSSKMFLFVFGGAILLLVALTLVSSSKKKSEVNYGQNQNATSLQISPDIMGIAALYNCSCGKCRDLSLLTCECPTADEERNFIQKQLESGKSVQNIIQQMDIKYGNKKG